MINDVTTPRSPGWWFKRLFEQLAARAPRYDLLDTYYRGHNVVPTTATRAIKEAYTRLMSMAATNYAELVVEAVRERMSPTAFRTGAQGDENGDDAAWHIWQANDLDADCALVHRASLAMGDAYVIVGAVDDEIEAPLITVEDPREVIVESDPRRKRRPLAGLKLIRLSDTEAAAFLYLPDGVHHASGKVASVGPRVFSASDWEWDGDVVTLVEGPAQPIPVVRFPNRIDAFGRTMGEFEPHLGLLDRICYGVLNRLEVATLQAFRQRAVKGIPDSDEDGNPIDYSDMFAANPGALWLLPESAEMWESGQVDLTPLKEAIRDDVKDLAAVTRTPLFYLSPEAAGTSGSAEGASLAREGLVFKTGDRLVQASDPWERVMSIAFRIAGDATRARQRDMQIVWAPPERFSLAERYDAATKAQAAGVPWRQVMETVLQFSPQEIARMEAERQGEQLVAAGIDAAGQPVDDGPTEIEDLKTRSAVLGDLRRAGATGESAAAAAGITGLEFIDGDPVTIKLHEDAGAGAGFDAGASPAPVPAAEDVVPLPPDEQPAP